MHFCFRRPCCKTQTTQNWNVSL